MFKRRKCSDDSWWWFMAIIIGDGWWRRWWWWWSWKQRSFFILPVSLNEAGIHNLDVSIFRGPHQIHPYCLKWGMILIEKLFTPETHKISRLSCAATRIGSIFLVMTSPISGTKPRNSECWPNSSSRNWESARKGCWTWMDGWIHGSHRNTPKVILASCSNDLLTTWGCRKCKSWLFDTYWDVCSSREAREGATLKWNICNDFNFNDKIHSTVTPGNMGKFHALGVVCHFLTCPTLQGGHSWKPPGLHPWAKHDTWSFSFNPKVFWRCSLQFRFEDSVLFSSINLLAGCFNLVLPRGRTHKTTRRTKIL